MCSWLGFDRRGLVPTGTTPPPPLAGGGIARPCLFMFWTTKPIACVRRANQSDMRAPIIPTGEPGSHHQPAAALDDGTVMSEARTPPSPPPLDAADGGCRRWGVCHVVWSERIALGK